jgi:hypothetical protein
MTDIDTQDQMVDAWQAADASGRDTPIAELSAGTSSRPTRWWPATAGSSREPLSLRPGSEEEVAAFVTNVEGFRKDKAREQVDAPYGLRYCPAYARQMKGPN